LVNYDIDTVLIAIRIASYGETMDVNFTVPVSGEQMTQTMNLPALLESIRNQTITDTCTLDNGLIIAVKPLTYKKIVDAQLKTFEQQKLYVQVNQSGMSAEEKTKQFTNSFKLLNDLNFQILTENISRINLPTGESVSDEKQIKEFIKNADAKLVKEIEDKLGEIRQLGAIKPVKIKATEEQIRAGVPATFEIPMTVDNSNFFG
jgi:hypothetical protein